MSLQVGDRVREREDAMLKSMFGDDTLFANTFPQEPLTGTVVEVVPAGARIKYDVGQLPLYDQNPDVLWTYDEDELELLS